MRSLREKTYRDPVCGLAAGVAAGLVASFVMNGFQELWLIVADQAKPARTKSDAEEPATVKAANKLALACTGKDIPKRFRPLAGTAMHYGLGAVLGGAYGAALALGPTISVGKGSVFGGACWLALDEGMLPATGLAKAWNQTPGGVHLYGFISHLVFGLALDTATRGFREMFAKV